MKDNEGLYIVPIGKAYDYKKNRRAIKAVKILKEFVLRHSKSEYVVLSMKTNEEIWSRSIQKPPRKIKVKIVKKDGIAYIYLPDEKIEEKKIEEKPAKEEKATEKVNKKEEEIESKEEKISEKPKKAKEDKKKTEKKKEEK
ncbi:MAG: 50S ribosomal protein L31e [Candidatus ainarchaeum sp.]|nr:50S ribosomal protein L31e [Candidatus ainarchaeum sp.]